MTAVQTLFDAMPVACVVVEGSHGHDPELDESWDDLLKLRWLAGIVNAETGLDLRIYHGRPDRFGVNYQNTSHSDRRYDDAWALLAGISAGAAAILAREERT